MSGLSTRMTTQRFARASRSRFFIGLGILILTVGFVAIFHNSQQELDQLRQMELRCEQQQLTLGKELTCRLINAHMCYLMGGSNSVHILTL